MRILLFLFFLQVPAALADCQSLALTDQFPNYLKKRPDTKGIDLKEAFSRSFSGITITLHLPKGWMARYDEEAESVIVEPNVPVCMQHGYKISGVGIVKTCLGARFSVLDRSLEQLSRHGGILKKPVTYHPAKGVTVSTIQNIPSQLHGLSGVADGSYTKKAANCTTNGGGQFRIGAKTFLAGFTVVTLGKKAFDKQVNELFAILDHIEVEKLP